MWAREGGGGVTWGMGFPWRLGGVRVNQRFEVARDGRSTFDASFMCRLTQWLILQVNNK